MFRNLLAAGAAAFVMSAAGAAHADFYLNSVTILSGTVDDFGLRNAGSPNASTGIVEVGGYAYAVGCCEALDYVDMHGLLDMAIVYESGNEADYTDPIPASTFLTFDVIHEGGTYAADPGFPPDLPATLGNAGRPFDGQLRISYAFTGNFESYLGPFTTLATLDLDPAWLDAGDTLSVDFSSFLPLTSFATPSVLFKFEAIGYSGEQAWTFGNFRATQTDQTNAFPPTAVPEPGTWALMILGFGAAGAALRRRSAATA
jgi:hypothetical protein